MAKTIKGVGGSGPGLYPMRASSIGIFSSAGGGTVVSQSAFEQAVYTVQGAAPQNTQVAWEQGAYAIQGTPPQNTQVAWEQTVYVITT